MLTFSRLGYRGNLGNQFFQIASLLSLAKKHHQEYCLPKWVYADFFDFEFQVGYADENFKEIKEQKFNYHEWIITNGNFDIDGYLQSEKYFDVSLVKKIFAFKSIYVESVKLKNQKLFSKKTILISVRRGDFVGNPNYYQINYKYYFLAITTQFPDWMERNLIFTSDDITYCKYHFKFLKNAFFIEKRDIMEQVVIGMFCDDYVISNSTFSWWQCWLGENTNTKVLRPLKNFKEKSSRYQQDIDYFPKRWTAFDDRDYKMSNEFFILKIRAFFYEISQYIKFQYATKLLAVKKWMRIVIKNKK